MVLRNVGFLSTRKNKFQKFLKYKGISQELNDIANFFLQKYNKILLKKNDNKDICSVRNDHHRGTGDRVRAVRPVWRSRGDRSWHLSAHRRSVGRRWIDRPFA